MKKILYLSLVFIILFAVTATAQSDYQKTVARYKNVKMVTAQVTKIVHKRALDNELVTRGGSFLVKPQVVSISTNDGQDRLVMNGTKFTMTRAGRDHVTDSKKNKQFETFHTVLNSIISGGSPDISNLPDVKVQKSGTSLSITITPIATDKKSQRRKMFQRIVLVMDMKTSDFRLLRLVERNGDYTDYEFTNHQYQ